MDGAKFFNYRIGSTFMHRMNPAVKIILMIVLAVAAFYIPLIPAAAIWTFLLLFSLIFLHFSALEILTDIKPTLFYLLILYIVSLISNIALFVSDNKEATLQDILRLFIMDKGYLPLLIKLALSLEFTSVFYRTTSIQQFNQGFSSIEHLVTRKDETPFADILSLTITFIPRLASYWARIDRAYRARGGKNGIRRILILVPVLFKVGMQEAFFKALARENRL